MKPRLLILVCGIPLASVLFGMVMFYFAFTAQNETLDAPAEPLSKTSWQTQASELSELEE